MAVGLSPLQELEVSPRSGLYLLVELKLVKRVSAELSTKFCDNGFFVDLGNLGHFCGTKFVWGGSQLYRFLLELEDWIPAGEVSAGAGAEAGSDWICGIWKEVVEF